MNTKPIHQGAAATFKRRISMNTTLRTAALSLALPGLMAASLPAAAATWQPASTEQASIYRDHDDDGDRGDRWEHGRGRGHNRGYNQQYYGQNNYQQPYYNNTYQQPYNNNSDQVWRGNDGRYYCKRPNGTTGLIVGGAAGALIGRSIAGRGDNTLGTILGAAGGALLGRAVERGSSSRCQ
jgi:hypothetical protein